MTIVPRFLDINGNICLMSVRMDEGRIVDIAGPVKIANAPSREALIAATDIMLSRALHESPVLLVSDLPEELQAKFQTSPTESTHTDDESTTPQPS